MSLLSQSTAAELTSFGDTHDWCKEVKSPVPLKSQLHAKALNIVMRKVAFRRQLCAHHESKTQKRKGKMKVNTHVTTWPWSNILDKVFCEIPCTLAQSLTEYSLVHWVKLVLWHHWMQVTQVHPVVLGNQFRSLHQIVHPNTTTLLKSWDQRLKRCFLLWHCSHQTRKKRDTNEQWCVNYTSNNTLVSLDMSRWWLCNQWLELNHENMCVMEKWEKNEGIRKMTGPKIIVTIAILCNYYVMSWSSLLLTFPWIVLHDTVIGPVFQFTAQRPSLQDLCTLLGHGFLASFAAR